MYCWAECLSWVSGLGGVRRGRGRRRLESAMSFFLLAIVCCLDLWGWYYFLGAEGYSFQGGRDSGIDWDLQGIGWALLIEMRDVRVRVRVRVMRRWWRCIVDVQNWALPIAEGKNNNRGGAICGLLMEETKCLNSLRQATPHSSTTCTRLTQWRCLL